MAVVPSLLYTQGNKMDLRQVSVTNIKGIGDKTAKCLQKLQVQSVYDLLWYVPRSYIKYPEITPFSEIREGMTVAVLGCVTGYHFQCS